MKEERKELSTLGFKWSVLSKSSLDFCSFAASAIGRAHHELGYGICNLSHAIQFCPIAWTILSFPLRYFSVQVKGVKHYIHYAVKGRICPENEIWTTRKDCLTLMDYAVLILHGRSNYLRQSSCWYESHQECYSNKEDERHSSEEFKWFDHQCL